MPQCYMLRKGLSCDYLAHFLNCTVFALMLSSPQVLQCQHNLLLNGFHFLEIVWENRIQLASNLYIYSVIVISFRISDLITKTPSLSSSQTSSFSSLLSLLIWRLNRQGRFPESGLLSSELYPSFSTL